MVASKEKKEEKIHTYKNIHAIYAICNICCLFIFTSVKEVIFNQAFVCLFVSKFT